jgi:hypothetical protein
MPITDDMLDDESVDFNDNEDAPGIMDEQWGLLASFKTACRN